MKLTKVSSIKVRFTIPKSYDAQELQHPRITTPKNYDT